MLKNVYVTIVLQGREHGCICSVGKLGQGIYELMKCHQKTVSHFLVPQTKTCPPYSI